MQQEIPAPVAALIEAGNRALATGDWEASRKHFEQALVISESPEALEGISMVAWWQDDVPVLFESRERAFALYREWGDDAGSTRMASLLALDYYFYRRAQAISNGWIARARRFLARIDYPSYEHGVFEAVVAHISAEEHDVAAIKRHAGAAIEIARRINSLDLEMLSLALYGLAEVKEGHVSDGMTRIDEAVTAALSGELSDPETIVTSCCHLIHACELVRDYERAVEWCDTVANLCERWSYRSMAAYCRARYAVILTLQGDWTQAERELLWSVQELSSHRAGWAPEVYLRLAHLRLRQGRFDEVPDLLEQAAEHPQSWLCRAELALAEGHAQEATDYIDRYCRRVSRHELTAVFDVLELQVRASTANGNLAQAERSLADLEQVANVAGTHALQASVYFARGLVARTRGDLAGARRSLEDAVDEYLRIGVPFEIAETRLELAAVLSDAGRGQSAAAECRQALDMLGRLGATMELRRATTLLQEIQAGLTRQQAEPMLVPGMTRRESQVLQLIACGRSNPEIADELFLSVRTVERHVSSIYQKIGAEGNSARAVATAYAFEHGLASGIRPGVGTDAE